MALLEKEVNGWKESIKRTESNISRLQVTREKGERHAKVRAFLLSEDDDPTPPLHGHVSSSSARSSDVSDEFDENAPMPLFLIRRNLPHQNSNNSQISCETDRESVSLFGSSLTDVYCLDPSLPSSTYLPGELIGTILRNNIYEDAIEDILKIISSNTHPLLHMNDVNFLMNQLRSVGTPLKIFDIGLHSIGFSLNDDEIKLLLLGDYQSGSESLEKQVTNIIRSISHTHGHSHGNNAGGAIHKKNNVNDIGSTDGSDSYSVSFNTQHQKPGLLVGSLNSGSSTAHTPFSLVFHDETEAALLLMFEEINQIVGKDDLFKKSVSLIRSWWIHESIIYVGATIKHYLPNTAFIVMVVAIFNKYHHVVQSPFQALCLFLGEFSLFNPTTQWISIEGFVDSPNVSNSSSTTGTTTPSMASFPTAPANAHLNLLLDQQFVNRFKELVHVQWNQQPHPPVQPSNSNPGSNNNSTENNHVLPLPPHESPSSSASSSGKQIHHHPSSGVYIVNPLNGSNMATEKLTANQVIRLTKALQNGAANLSVFIRQLGEDGQNNSPKQAQLIKNFFPNIVSAATTSTSKHEIR